MVFVLLAPPTIMSLYLSLLISPIPIQSSFKAPPTQQSIQQGGDYLILLFISLGQEVNHWLVMVFVGSVPEAFLPLLSSAQIYYINI